MARQLLTVRALLTLPSTPTLQAFKSKKSKSVNIPKLDDALLAGTKESGQCTLILTEGDSAKALAVSGLEVVGRDYFGVFPLRGKVLNVRDASSRTLAANAEVKALCNIIGLDFSKKYDNEEEIETLRYGKVMLMTDQDPDGSHIKGLVVNFIHYFWPELLKAKPNFMAMFVTPLVKCFKGTEEVSFSSVNEFHEWRNKEDRKGWRIKYYKGLGTSTSKEGKEYFKNIESLTKDFEWGDGDGDKLDMAFDKKKSEERRRWLLDTFDAKAVPAFNDLVSFTQFVDEELIHFSAADNVRSIPSVIDGLKPSQRKVLYACFKKNLKSEIKVAQLAGYVAEQTAYHHGEMSLHSTIVGMAQDYVGSNNVNLLVPGGQFGTRLMGGKDSASPRYIFTRLQPYTRKIFSQLDDPILDYLEDDGQSIEPSFYVPVVPMLVLNGSHGIGTGWSTSIPSFNPSDVISYIRFKLDGADGTFGETLQPWVRGFSGTYDVVKDVQRSTGSIRRSKGRRRKSEVIIEELPVGRWTSDYKDFLSKLLEDGDIKSFTSEYTTSSVLFRVKLSKSLASKDINHISSKLKLSTRISMSNMNAFNKDGIIRKYDSAEEIIDEWFEVRMHLYKKRKEGIVRRLAYEKERAEARGRFIEVVGKGDIDLFSGAGKDELGETLREKGFKTKRELDGILSGREAEEGLNGDDYDYLLNMGIGSFTKENRDQIAAEMKKRAFDLGRAQGESVEDMWRRDLDEIEQLIC